jgi:hypothetical protein
VDKILYQYTPIYERILGSTEEMIHHGAGYSSPRFVHIKDITNKYVLITGVQMDYKPSAMGYYESITEAKEAYFKSHEYQIAKEEVDWDAMIIDLSSMVPFYFNTSDVAHPRCVDKKEPEVERDDEPVYDRLYIEDSNE